MLKAGKATFAVFLCFLHPGVSNPEPQMKCKTRESSSGSHVSFVLLMEVFIFTEKSLWFIKILKRNDISHTYYKNKLINVSYILT